MNGITSIKYRIKFCIHAHLFNVGTYLLHNNNIHAKF